MPVTETIETYTSLIQTLGLPVGMLVVNRFHPGTADTDLVERLRRGAGELPGIEALVADEVARRAAEENGWAAINRDQLERLRAAVPLPTLVLPAIFAEEFGAQEVARLSWLLEVECAAGREGRGRVQYEEAGT
jgi:hypothetical protein